LKPVIGEKDLFSYELEPGKKVIVKTDPITMKQLQSKSPPSTVGNLINQGSLSLFVTQQSSNHVTRVDGKTLNATIKIMDKNR
jgi:hypothetical protein